MSFRKGSLAGDSLGQRGKVTTADEPSGLKGPGLKAGQQTGVLLYRWSFKDRGECVWLDVSGAAEAEPEKCLVLPGQSCDEQEWGYLKAPGPGVHSYFCILQREVKTLAWPISSVPTPWLPVCSPQHCTDSTVPWNVPG